MLRSQLNHHSLCVLLLGVTRSQKVCCLSNISVLYRFIYEEYIIRRLRLTSLKTFLYLFLSAGSKRPLIMQSPPPDVPTSAAPDLLLTSDHKKKQKERSKERTEQMDKNHLYDISNSSSKDPARLTLKLSQHKKRPPRQHIDSEHESDLMNNNNNNNQLSGISQRFSHKLGGEEQANCKQFPFLPNSKETGGVSGVVYDDADIDTLAEFERIERESANERERWSKEVQDKGEFVCVTNLFVLRLF